MALTWAQASSQLSAPKEVGYFMLHNWLCGVGDGEGGGSEGVGGGGGGDGEGESGGGSPGQLQPSQSHP